jgi:hypothetical protein
MAGRKPYSQQFERQKPVHEFKSRVITSQGDFHVMQSTSAPKRSKDQFRFARLAQRTSLPSDLSAYSVERLPQPEPSGTSGLAAGGFATYNHDGDRLHNLEIPGNGDHGRIKSEFRGYVACPHGEVSEWLKEHAWKACVGVTLPRVRIPPSPPSSSPALSRNGLPLQFPAHCGCGRRGKLDLAPPNDKMGQPPAPTSDPGNRNPLGFLAAARQDGVTYAPI